MSERENELAKASAENGTFDSEKAKKAAADAARQFQGQLKRTERLATVGLIACLAVFALAWARFAVSTNDKATVGFAMVVIIVFLFGVLVKLWYWGAITRITLQKDLKQWQLRPLAAAPAGVAAGSETDAAAYRPWRALSLGERLAWGVTALVVTGVVFYWAFFCFPLRHAISDHVVVSESGAASNTTNTCELYPNSLSGYWMSDLKCMWRWFDESGREVPVPIETEDGRRRYYVVPVEWRGYTEIFEKPGAATKEGNVWTFKHERKHGNKTPVEYFLTVELPRGAKVISQEPEPVQSWSDGGTTRMQFQTTRKAMEPFRCQIQYELVDSVASEKPPK